MNFNEAKQWIKEKNDVSALEKLSCSINTGVSTDDENGRTTSITLLGYAIKYDNAPAVEKLLSMGFDLGQESEWEALATGNTTILSIIKKHENEQIDKITKTLDKSSLESAEGQILHLYKSSSSKAKNQEIHLQKYVSDRFFRADKPMKKSSKSNEIYEKLLAIDSKHELETNRMFHVEHAITLDGYYPRSVIIALSKFLNKYNYIPTVAFKIGKSHILCKSNPTSGQPGNVVLQTINATGTNIFTPAVYGDGNGKIDASIPGKLEAIIKANPNHNIHDYMHKCLSPIQSTTDCFLDQLNLLHNIIEIARYSHKDSSLQKFPIASAQVRTSKLLTDNKITSNHAFGLDTAHEHYKPTVLFSTYDGKGETAVQRHKAPYGAVTGKSLKDHTEEVKTKIIRINDKHQERYADHPGTEAGHSWLEGCNLHKSKLVDAYGSGNESDGSDYSDDEAPELPENKIEKVKLNKKYM